MRHLNIFGKSHFYSRIESPVLNSASATRLASENRCLIAKYDFQVYKTPNPPTSIGQARTSVARGDAQRFD